MTIDEPLKELQEETWPDLMESFRSDWPKHILGYYLLERETEWNRLGLDYGFKVYCPFGDIKYGMVGMNIKKDCYEIIIQCGEDTTKLREALVKTKIIDWTKQIVVAYAPLHVIKCLREVTKGVPAKIHYEYYSHTFIVLKDSKPYHDIQFPKNTTVNKLKEEHAITINNAWPYKYENSQWYFERVIKSGSGYGLFQDDSLAAWVVINEAGNLCNLYTIDRFRRKGYAEMLVKWICNYLLAQHKDTIAYCMVDNEKALKLYEKLGFKQFDDVAWVYIKPDV